MPPSPPPSADPAPWLPSTVLLLGTDAAGKNHVADVWIRRLAELGQPLLVQEGWLSAPPGEPQGDDEKSWLSKLAEETFLTVFPLLAWALPTILNLLLYRDLRRFPDDGRRRLVVSHSALRILAFTLGARGRGEKDLPASSRRALAAFRRRSRAVVLVLDVDHDVRRRRIEARRDRGDDDPFDRFMLADGERSERIEACLVDLATEDLGAHLIVNDALDDDALWRELQNACAAAAGRADSAGQRDAGDPSG
ncbi:MAG: hypothetical protein AAFX50_01205 [Acidobacteriota bacterium]